MLASQCQPCHLTNGGSHSNLCYVCARASCPSWPWERRTMRCVPSEWWRSCRRKTSWRCTLFKITLLTSFLEGIHKKCIFTCVFFQICLKFASNFLRWNSRQIWVKFESNLSENLGTKAQVLRSFNLRCQRITFEWKPRLIKAQVLRSFNHILGPQCNTKPT